MKTILPLLSALVLVVSTASAKQVIVLPASAPGSEAILLGTDSVRRELKVTSLQAAVLDSIRDEYREKARAIVAKVGDSVEAKKEATKKLDALQRSYDRRALQALNASQRARLAQIQHQLLGGYMLLEPAVRQQLGITKKQLEKIAKIWDKGQKYVSEVNGWYENGEISFNERLAYLREDRLDRSEDLLDVLTPEQRAELEKLSGDKFLG